MSKVLVVVDMQNDFIDGALGTPEAESIVSNVVKAIKEFDGTVLYTMDTHGENYMNTQEGGNLPVPHCIKGTYGWELHKDIEALRKGGVFEKPGFGSREIGERLLAMNNESPLESITFVGLCTDICVITNVMVTKTFLPEVPLIVKSDCCAGVTPESHENALKAMEMCQVQIL